MCIAIIYPPLLLPQFVVEMPDLLPTSIIEVVIVQLKFHD
jgi:hypothetical protein